jgi:carbamoyltransferase
MLIWADVAASRRRSLSDTDAVLAGTDKARTGCPILVNTSFNVRGEPIACTPEDAFRCLMGTEIEVLVAGKCFLRKERQDPAFKLDYRNVFDPD